MNDYETLKEVLEMAEVLTAEREDTLEVLTYSDTTGNSTTVIFEFNGDRELINVFTEDQ